MMLRRILFKRSEEAYERANRKLALEAFRRGTGKKLRMPMAGDIRRAQFGSGPLHGHENNDGSGHRYRSGGVHGNAERAMVGGRFNGVDVRHLNNGQEREQQQAHNRHQRQSAKLCVERVAEVILRCCQHTFLRVKDTRA